MKKLLNPSLEWTIKLKEAEVQYSFQSKLTEKLDSHNGDFTEQTLLEIVLWKVNRYPTITDDLLNDINDLRKDFSLEKSKKLLMKLLQKEYKGFDLPMASTVLRFACPEHFQIIDQRVYRLITVDEDSLKIPYNIDKKIELYFNYIEKLKSICNEFNIPFRIVDRVLYQLDKNVNKDFGLTTYSK